MVNQSMRTQNPNLFGDDSCNLNILEDQEEGKYDLTTSTVDHHPTNYYAQQVQYPLRQPSFEASVETITLEIEQLDLDSMINTLGISPTY